MANHPLTIAVDALGTPTGGGVTFTRSLLAEMARLRPEYRFRLYYASEAVGADGYSDNVERVLQEGCAGVVRRWLWEQTQLPGELRRTGADVLVCMNGFTCFSTRLPQVAAWQNARIVSRTRIDTPWKVASYMWLQRQLQRLSARKATQNVFLTRHFAELTGTWWRLDRVSHCVIHSGIDASRVDPACSADAERSHTALSIGHTYFHKNYESLIDAFEVYRERYDDGLCLVIIGGPEAPAYHESLEARIAEKGLQDTVRMLGAADPAEVTRQYGQCRIYVTTSLLESFGLTTLEAMANGLPVLAPEAACFPEVCGDAALYCDPLDPKDIAEKLHLLATDAALRAELRERGMAHVGRFSWERCAEAYLGEIERAARRASGAEVTRP